MKKEPQRVPNKMNTKRLTPRHIMIKMSKVKEKRETLKSSKRKAELPTGEFPLDCQMISQKKLCRLEEIGKKYSKS